MDSLTKHNLFFIALILFISSCDKKCSCELVIYDSKFETNYEWIEIDRKSTDLCENDTMLSSFLDSNANISYVKSIIECIE